MKRALFILAGLAIGLAITGGATVIYSTRKEQQANERRYSAVIADAERVNGLPANLLKRLLYHESRFRTDIIDGTTKSRAGAIGIAQIVPKWHPGVDPYNPEASIRYAAGYLRKLRDQFGSWALALAAYNWGPGNVAKDTAGRDWPDETREYVADITADVPAALA